MFRHKHHDKASEAKPMEKVAEAASAVPKLAKKGSLSWFVPSILKRPSTKTAEDAANGGAREADANFEMSNPASMAPQTPMGKQSSSKHMAPATPRGSDLSRKGGTPDREGSLTPASGATTPMKSLDSFSNGGSSRKIPSVSLDTAGLPPALQNRDENVPSRPPAMSIGSSVIDRYWHLSDVLEDRNVVLNWRTRVLMALDVARELKKLHQAAVAHCRLLADVVLVTQESRCKIQDAGSLL
jgi:hypothetical protein